MAKKAKQTEAEKVLCNIFKRFGTDLQAEQEGRKYYLDRDIDAYILVASYKRNKNLQRENVEILERAEHKGDDVEQEFVKAFVRNCVKGWNNISNIEGEELPYSNEAALELLVQLPDLVEDLIKFASDNENYRIEEIAKN